MFEKFLQDIGLNEKEAKVYLELLQTDSASVIDIADKTKINRTTVYTVIESLAQKGLVSETTVGKKTQYQAEPPERLETFVERQRVVLEEKSKLLKGMVAQIKSIQKQSGEKPTVRYFEGKDSVVSTMEELFSNDYDKESDEIIYFIYPKDLVDDLFSEADRKKYRQMRLSQKIKSKVIYTWNNDQMYDDDTGERVKIDKNKYPLTCDISIYKDVVRVSILGGRVSGLIIRSLDFANTLRSVFNLAFDKIKETPDHH